MYSTAFKEPRHRQDGLWLLSTHTKALMQTSPACTRLSDIARGCLYI